MLLVGLCSSAAYEYDAANDLVLGIYGPITSVSQEFLAAAVAFDIDLRKNFEPALKAKYGDPIVKIDVPHPDLKGIKIVIGTSDSQGIIGMRTAMDWFLGTGGSPRIVGLVGGYHSAISMPVASAGAVFKVPQVSWASTSPALSNKGRYPYFLRTVPPDSIQGAAMWGWFKHFGVPVVSFVYALEPYGEGLFQAFSENAAKAKETSRLTGHGMVYFPGADNYDFEEQRKRVIAVRDTGDRFIILGATSDQVGPILKLFEEEGMLYTEKYQWLGSEAVYLVRSGALPSKSFPIGFQRLQPKTKGKLFDKFTDLWKKITVDDIYSSEAVARYRIDLMKVLPDNATAPKLTNENIQSIAQDGYLLELPFLFDAAYSFVTVIDKMLKSGTPKKDIHGVALHEALMDTHFEGISGVVTFNKQGDRLASYELWVTLVGETEVFTQVGEFDVATSILTTSTDPTWTDGKTGKEPPEMLFACGKGAGWNEQTSLCAPCSAGQFSPGGSKVRCERCPPGKRGNKPEGSDSCVPCAKGNYTSDGKRCYRCQKGTYNDKARASACKSCEEGKFGSSMAAAACRVCPEGRTTWPGVQGATGNDSCVCNEGLYGRLIAKAPREPLVAYECVPCALSPLRSSQVGTTSNADCALTWTTWVYIWAFVGSFLILCGVVYLCVRGPLARKREFWLCCRSIDEAMADPKRIPRFDPETLVSFVPPGELFVEEAPLLASALVCFQSRLHAGKRLSRRQRHAFQWLVARSYDFMDGFLSTAVADASLLTSIEERAALGDGQSRRIYCPGAT